MTGRTGLALGSDAGCLPEAPVGRRSRAALHLPPIHHFWVRRYVRPKLEACGFEGFEPLVLEALAGLCSGSAREHLVISLGAGGCDAEVLLASRLLARGIDNFALTCVDADAMLLARGRRLGQRHGVLPVLRFAVADALSWRPVSGTSAYIANDLLHSLPDIERVLDGWVDSLSREGLVLVYERIGRNHHRLWPEALEAIEGIWRQLPLRYKANHSFGGRMEERFVNRERCRYPGDGRYAEHVLPLLLDRLHFERFVAFGGLTDVFVDRSFGPNFDPYKHEDRGFFEEIAMLAEAVVDAGAVKPTQMIAVLRREPAPERVLFRHRSPEFCVRYP
jgi:hypothetical protein